MENIYKHCIFCGEELGEDDLTGTGEHVIPKYLYGSFCIHDVCRKCNSKLGQSADHRAIEDPRIVNAVQALNLPDLQAKIRDHASGEVVDEEGNYVVPASFKDGQPKTVTKELRDGSLICDERDALRHLANILGKDAQAKWNVSHCEAKARSLVDRYDPLKPGEQIHDPDSGLTLKKNPANFRYTPTARHDAAHGLVAKIVFEMVFLLLPPTTIAGLREKEELRDAAFSGVKLGLPTPNHILVPCPSNNAPLRKPDYNHQIVAWAREGLYFLDVHFFGTVDFRVVLRPREPDTFMLFADSFEAVNFVMTFEPGKKEKRYIYTKRRGSPHTQWKEVTDSL